MPDDSYKIQETIDHIFFFSHSENHLVHTTEDSKRLFVFNTLTNKKISNYKFGNKSISNSFSKFQRICSEDSLIDYSVVAAMDIKGRLYMCPVKDSPTTKDQPIDAILINLKQFKEDKNNYAQLWFTNDHDLIVVAESSREKIWNIYKLNMKNGID
jgi:hypothetical protein